jgi:hypothetical protein
MNGNDSSAGDEPPHINPPATPAPGAGGQVLQCLGGGRCLPADRGGRYIWRSGAGRRLAAKLRPNLAEEIHRLPCAHGDPRQSPAGGKEQADQGDADDEADQADDDDRDVHDRVSILALDDSGESLYAGGHHGGKPRPPWKAKNEIFRKLRKILFAASAAGLTPQPREMTVFMAHSLIIYALNHS